MADPKPLRPLTIEQAEASTPSADVWLAASAGTGKTQVLSARVLRLLLNGEAPESILCLTFTKSGAAEMAERVHGRLAGWVRASAKLIHSDLAALGEPRDAARIEFARTLFAHVLDARGGGLRIQTIHSFCQTLLANFPAEAGLTAGFRPLEEREARKLAQNVLADLVSEAVSGGDLGFIARLQRLVLKRGEDATRQYLTTCARAGRAFAALGGGVDARVRRALSLPAEDVTPLIAQGCADDSIDGRGLVRLRDFNIAWGTDRGLARAAKIDAWLALTPEFRAATLAALRSCWSKADGTHLGVSKGWTPTDDSYAICSDRLHQYFGRLNELLRRQALADEMSDALCVGQSYACAYDEAKRAAGTLDFDDLIDSAAALLAQPGMGDWVRYKLDSGINHILVDEAQDTNDKQWTIIKALAEEFYAGRGAKEDKRRTIFTVGDSKQAIFGFQGTDPRAMLTARDWFDGQARGVDRDLLSLQLRGSFRSSPPILALVDMVIATLDACSLGLSDDEPRHISQTGQYGQVQLFRPVVAANVDGGSAAGDEEGVGPDVAPSATHQLARDIATLVAGWLRDKMPIELRVSSKSVAQSRALEPRDVMILLRSRSTLAQLIVARLAEAGVPVAGIDRLRLNTPLVVRDVLAAMHFALQPNDDLTLASLLVSPLLGWSQEELQRVALARGKRSLWRFIRQNEPEASVAPLRTLLTLGDRGGPCGFIETLLSGDLSGRAKLFARFGIEARDPLDELLNAAIAFERNNVPNLQGFVDWFERDMDDIKRDAAASENAVRVLTVHGAKGLQAPVVILADATRDPELMTERILDWPLDDSVVPIPQPKSADRVNEIAALIADADARALEEHWRLLYVALTRAEERLVIMGALGARPLSSKSWYTVVRTALDALGARLDVDERLVFGTEPPHVALDTAPQAVRASPAHPDWIGARAPQETRPARPLSPSAYTDDQTAAPPPSAAMRDAATRGRILHALFERLPSVPVAHRRRAADVWLAQSEAINDAGRRTSLINDALRVIDDPAFADIFGIDALAEAPIAGVVDGIVIAGTVDRLVVTADTVTVLDFKTARRVPSSRAAIPEAHLRQMSAYAAVLRTIFPDHNVQAALLYTSGPTLFALDDALLAAHKPSYQLEQQVLAARS